MANEKDNTVPRNLPIYNASIYVYNKLVARSNKNGFFTLILNKRSLPDKICFKYDNKTYEKNLVKKENTDWEIIYLFAN